MEKVADWEELERMSVLKCSQHCWNCDKRWEIKQKLQNEMNNSIRRTDSKVEL